jgi:DNA-binding IclR family transcriptional regulator
LKPASPTPRTPDIDGVISVTRALRILEVFGINDAHLSLADISRRTGLHKTTVLRIARTLAADHYLVHSDDGTWRLGRASGWLGACYQATFNAQEVVEPALRELSIKTGESASFYVREGDFRTCVLRVEGPKAIRHHVRIGANLPLHLGAPGRVILAFSGQAGKPYEEIRRRGYHLSLGEREPEVSSVAAPVFEAQWRLLGSLCISGPTARLSKSRLLAIAPAVVDTANQVSYALAGRTAIAAEHSHSKSTWHP